MVRLSKGYGALLTPFVDSKGNFGKSYSRDMSWAAPRYTEAKLSAICGEIFKDIDSDTVDFVDNYDNTMKEPSLLPTTYPNVLVSANQGIAVGMASQICGFNLGEVCDTTIACLKNPDHDIASTLLAPDFPTGGQIICDNDELRSIYATGRGGLKVRARWRYDKKENVIEVYEIPYSTAIETILDKVAELVKAGKIKEIADMRDETDLSGLKLAIDLKRGVDPDKLMAKLFRLTPLQDTVSCNFNILIAGNPRVMGVGEILDEWIAWRMECIRRRVFFDLQKKRAKLHLLQGLRQILLDIDKAIHIIRTTEEALKAVPDSYRTGSLALGATKLQTIWRVVLPTAFPNITTGLILSIGRVSGETAPILFTAAAYFLPKLPTSIYDQVMALPYHLYVIATSGTDLEATRPMAYGTALVLIVIVLAMNLLASFLRRHFGKKVKTN